MTAPLAGRQGPGVPGMVDWRAKGRVQAPFVGNGRKVRPPNASRSGGRLVGHPDFPADPPAWWLADLGSWPGVSLEAPQCTAIDVSIADNRATFTGKVCAEDFEALVVRVIAVTTTCLGGRSGGGNGPASSCFPCFPSRQSADLVTQHNSRSGPEVERLPASTRSCSLKVRPHS
jgi:hypothetical protein